MLANNKMIFPGAALLLLASMSVFTVQEYDRTVKFKLGEMVGVDYKPGLHFKIPFINDIKKFDKRVLTLDAQPERFLTSEKKNVIVDSYVKWRVGDVKRYYTAVAGDIEQANMRLDQIVKDIMRSEFSKRTIRDLVSEKRLDMHDILIRKALAPIAALGIDIVDIKIKRIDLPKEVSSSVYRRMEAERERVAREFRSQGAEAAERIRANADKERAMILADAYEGTEKLRGEGDAIAAETYASGYQQDPEFFALYRSLNAYKKTFEDKDDVMVLNPDSDFFKYFGKQ